jgi:hypothetical protein
MTGMCRAPGRRGNGVAVTPLRSRMLPIVVQRLITTLPWAWPSRMYRMAAGAWLSG